MYVSLFMVILSVDECGHSDLLVNVLRMICKCVHRDISLISMFIVIYVLCVH